MPRIVGLTVSGLIAFVVIVNVVWFAAPAFEAAWRPLGAILVVVVAGAAWQKAKHG